MSISATHPTLENEPWFYRVLELYARIGIWIGGIIFGVCITLAILGMAYGSIRSTASYFSNHPATVAPQGPQDVIQPIDPEAMPVVDHPRMGLGDVFREFLASIASALVLLAISLFGLLTFWLPSMLILLVVDSARNLRSLNN